MRILVLAIALTGTNVAARGQKTTTAHEKEIYIPEDLRSNDFNDNSSKWSYRRMRTSDNFVIFWDKGFGDDMSKAPQLEGHDMRVDLDNLVDKLESFYAFYKDSMRFVLPGSKSEKYKMMAMLNYSLEGTAYGGDYDGTIGALWIAPNRVQDKKLNCIAHEIGHSFQSQIIADGTGECWGGGGIFEMTSQWMLWNVNPEWVKDENYHWQFFRKHTYLPFLAGENIYTSPYVLEYWSMRHGLTVMADLFRAGKRGEDPALTYMRMFLDKRKDIGLPYMPDEKVTVLFADELLDCYSRLITFDFPRVKSVCKPHINQLSTETKREGDAQGRQIIRPTEEQTPQTFGCNVISISETAGKHKVTFHGEGDKTRDGFAYKLVCTDDLGNAKYSKVRHDFDGDISINTPEGFTHTYLVVVAYPKEGYKPREFNPYAPQDNSSVRQYGYHFEK